MEDPTFEKTNIKKWIAIAIGVVLVIFIGFWQLTRYWHKLPPTAAEFGDSFGAANALFSALAFGFLIVTVLMQRRELEFQRKELQDTRKEFKQQNATLKQQLFENTLFSMISLHHQIVDDIDLEIKASPSNDYTSSTITGRDVFRNRFKAMNRKLKENTSSPNEAYEEMFHERRTDFAHYYRNLYRVFKMIDEYDFTNKSVDGETDQNLKERLQETERIKAEKYKYAAIVRAQLSDYELLLLFFNGLTEKGKNFKVLIERYSILDNLNQDEIKNKKWMESYHHKAFNSALRFL